MLFGTWRGRPKTGDSQPPLPSPPEQVTKPPRQSKPKRVAPTPVVEEDDISLASQLRKHIFVAAEAERRLGIALGALSKIANGQDDPTTFARQKIAEIG